MPNPYRKPDRFSMKAKDEGYRARSVYKLKEIDERFSLLHRGARVLDLGCAPGSWSAYAIERVGAGRVVGIDLTPVALPGGHFFECSIFAVVAEEMLAALGGRADVVLSDIAPLTTGARDADHFAQIELAQKAFELATQVLTKGGAFVAKVFDGSDAKPFEQAVRKRFSTVKRARPEAVRQNSREFYIVAKGFTEAS